MSEKINPISPTERIWPITKRKPKTPPIPGETLEKVENAVDDPVEEVESQPESSEEGRVDRLA